VELATLPVLRKGDWWWSELRFPQLEFLAFFWDAYLLFGTPGDPGGICGEDRERAIEEAPDPTLGASFCFDCICDRIRLLAAALIPLLSIVLKSLAEQKDEESSSVKKLSRETGGLFRLLVPVLEDEDG
jgi:hypothetical protein